MDYNKDTISFICQTQTPDNWVMSEITNFKLDTYRHNLSSLDIVYALFNNTDVIHTLKSRIKGHNSDFVKFRDGIDYFSKIEKCRRQIQESMKNEPEKWNRSIFSHFVFLLSKLSWSANYPQNQSIYFQKSWQDKIIKTQLGAYCDIKHDLNLKHVHSQNFGSVCSFPDIYVEPNLEFWQEFRRLVKSIDNFIKQIDNSILNFHKKSPESEYNKNNSDNHLFEFDQTLAMLEDAVSYQNSNIPFPVEFEKKIKQMIYFNSDESNSSKCNGWYLRLLHNMNDNQKFKFEPQITNIFTGQPDILSGDEGNILYIANMPPRIGVVLVENAVTKTKKCFLSCSYNPIEIYKPFNKSMTDAEWKQELEDDLIKIS